MTSSRRWTPSSPGREIARPGMAPGHPTSRVLLNPNERGPRACPAREGLVHARLASRRSSSRCVHGATLGGSRPFTRGMDDRPAPRRPCPTSLPSLIVRGPDPPSSGIRCRVPSHAGSLAQTIASGCHRSERPAPLLPFGSAGDLRSCCQAAGSGPAMSSMCPAVRGRDLVRPCFEGDVVNARRQGGHCSTVVGHALVASLVLRYG